MEFSLAKDRDWVWLYRVRTGYIAVVGAGKDIESNFYSNNSPNTI